MEEQYQDAKNLVDERQKVANDKAYNKAASESAKAAAVVTEIKVRDAAAKAEQAAKQKIKEDEAAKQTTLAAVLAQDESNGDNRAAANKQAFVVATAEDAL